MGDIKIMEKDEFIEKFLHDQKYKRLPSRNKINKKVKKTKSVLPFKEETYLDIINLFREKFGEELEVIKDKDVIVKYKGDSFSIKIISKRSRVKL